MIHKDGHFGKVIMFSMKVKEKSAISPAILKMDSSEILIILENTASVFLEFTELKEIIILEVLGFGEEQKCQTNGLSITHMIISSSKNLTIRMKSTEN